MRRKRKRIVDRTFVLIDEQLRNDPDELAGLIERWMKTCAREFERRHTQYKVETISAELSDSMKYFTKSISSVLITVKGVLR